jgi:phage terminase large subunit-like protein
MGDVAYGRTEPRLFTPALRPLTRETTLGYEVIDFAEQVLHVSLYPWQQWLLIHALELNEDGSYRFRKVIVEVARQNGKTTLMGVLAAWWLFVDSHRHPDRVPPVKFVIVGAAQTLDNAKGPYNQVKIWSNPRPETEEDNDLAVPALQSEVAKISNVNGEEAIIAYSRAQYIVRAANNIRSKSAAKAIFDELREQHTEDGWNAVSQITKAIWSGQLWGISNAGDYRSIVLKKQVDKGRSLVRAWHEFVDAGIQSIEEWLSANDGSFGYFEWSAPDKCAVDDEAGILQANPSVGYGPMSVQSIRSDIDGMSEAHFRTEVLCQWVTADVDPYIDPKRWAQGIDENSAIAANSRIVLGIDVSDDRQTTWISAAGFRPDGLPHVETILRRDGIMWVPKVLDLIKTQNPGITEIAIQGKGCPASDLIDPLVEKGWTVHRVEGSKLGSATGRIKDRVREGKLRHPPQPAIENQVNSAIVRHLGEVVVWNRRDAPIQISGLVAESYALFGLEAETPELQPESAYGDHGLMIL